LVGVGGGRRFTIGSVVLAIAEDVDEADEEVDDEDRDAGA